MLHLFKNSLFTITYMEYVSATTELNTTATWHIYKGEILHNAYPPPTHTHTHIKKKQLQILLLDENWSLAHKQERVTRMIQDG